MNNIEKTINDSHIKKLIGEEIDNNIEVLNKTNQLKKDIITMIANAELSVPQAIKLLNDSIDGVLIFSRVIGLDNID